MTPLGAFTRFNRTNWIYIDFILLWDNKHPLQLTPNAEFTVIKCSGPSENTKKNNNGVKAIVMMMSYVQFQRFNFYGFQILCPTIIKRIPSRFVLSVLQLKNFYDFTRKTRNFHWINNPPAILLTTKSICAATPNWLPYINI